MALTLMVIILLQGLCESEGLSLTGKVGKEINITCSHTYASSNIKYFCKGECLMDDILVKSSTRHNGRFKIEDRGNSFSVIISDLKMQDAGMYWCGIERVGFDTYTQVWITVEEAHEKAGERPKDKTLFPEKRFYIGAGLGIVVLALTMVLLLLVQHKRRRIHTSPGGTGNTSEIIYTTVAFKQEDGNHDTAASIASGNKNSAKNVFSLPQNQTDGLVYSTITFVKHSDDHSTIEPHSATE